MGLSSCLLSYNFVKPLYYTQDSRTSLTTVTYSVQHHSLLLPQMQSVLWTRNSHEIICVYVSPVLNSVSTMSVVSCLQHLTTTEPDTGEAIKSLHLEGGTKDSQGTPCLLQQFSRSGNFS